MYKGQKFGENPPIDTEDIVAETIIVSDARTRLTDGRKHG